VGTPGIVIVVQKDTDRGNLAAVFDGCRLATNWQPHKPISVSVSVNTPWSNSNALCRNAWVGYWHVLILYALLFRLANQ
jgi:hypothetical protein